MSDQLFIPGKLPGLNEIIEARSHFGKAAGAGGKRWNAYSDLKRSWGQKVALYALRDRFSPITTPARFSYSFYEEDRRRDPSNFVAGGIKIIEDALQEAGLLPNDGWQHVLGIRVEWFVLADQPPGVLLRVEREAASCPTEETSRTYRRRSAS